MSMGPPPTSGGPTSRRKPVVARVSAWGSVLLMGAAVVVAAACSVEPPAARPADAYASIEELADALEDAGLCEEFIDKSHRTKNFEFGECWPPGADRGSADFVLLSRYPEEGQRDKWKRSDSRGCDGPMIYGPNWSVGPVDRNEAETIIGNVGGEPVGWTERDC